MTVDVTRRGSWRRIYDDSKKRFKFRYYYKRVRMPWLAWVMFS